MWIKLIDEKPTEEDVYYTLCYSEYGTKWTKQSNLWTKLNGFQPQDFYTNREAHPLNLNVSHWFKTDNIHPLPIEDAEKLLIETEVFFEHERLIPFIVNNDVKVYEKYGNALSVIITGLSPNVLEKMRAMFKSNGVHKVIKKS